MKMIADEIQTGDNLRVIFDDAAIDDLLLAAEINGAVGVHTAAVEAGDPLAEMEAATVLLALLGRLAKPARAVILQNRDRSTPAMIAQMTQIASGPDYYRVAPTKEFASGTPIVFGNDNMLPPGVVIGRKDKAVAADGQRFPVRYAVVEAADVLTSNKADGTAIPEYEGGAYGKLRAIAGNGRLAGLIASFDRGTAADYVRELAEDDAHGIAPEAIAGFARPVLVRVMQQEDVTENIGDISNQRGTSDLSPVEQAQNDSKRLNLSDLEIRDDGAPSESAALAFIAAMPESERNNLMDGKHPGQKAYDRLMATVFWKAYGDAELVRLYAQSVDAEVKTILGGMASAAADLAKLDGAGELDIRAIISEAAGLAVNAKRQGVKLSLFAQQADMTLDPDAISVVRMFVENIRSAKKIGERLRAAARFAYEEFTKEDNDMFGAVEKASREQVLAQLEKPVEAPESSLFDAVGDMPASWLGFKLVNQAAVEEMGAALPSDKGISGSVWVALTDSDGDALFVAGKVVGVTFTAAAVRYSVAFPVAPQPREGVIMYAVVENIESGLVLSELPEDETVFDAVLTEDAAVLMPVAELVPVPAPVLDAAIFDSIDPMLELELSSKLITRTAELGEVDEDDPLAQLAIADEIMGIIRQLTDADMPDAPAAAAAPAVVAVEPEQIDPLASARARLGNDPAFRKLTRDFTSSLSVIKGVDEGTERGWDRALFVNSIAGKIKTQAKKDSELAGMLLAWLNAAQHGWKKPAITARNSVWASMPDWAMYNPLFGHVAPAPAKPQPVVKRADDYADTGNYDVIALDGKTYQIYRDRENGWWYQANTGRHFSEDVVGFSKEEAVKGVIERGFQRPAPAAKQPAAPAAELTGRELGEFDETPEGRKALRAAAAEFFTTLRATRVFNASLDADIEFVREGIRKALSFSADPRKLKLVPALPKILSTAVDVKKLPARGNDPDVVAMHALKADVALDGASLTVRVLVKERKGGSFFYDHAVNKEDLGGSTELLDSVDSTGLSLIALLCPEPSAQQVLLDSVGASGEFFNLFIEGEAPEATVEDDLPATAAAEEAPATEPERPHATEAEGRAALDRIKPFMPKMQRSFILEAMNGEEAQYFFDKMVEMATLIGKMPKTYDQDGLGNKAIVTLHYFRASSDWYITEKDIAGRGTEQAFGLAVLNGDRQNAELGYISIDELVARNVELDLNWEKKTVGMVKQAMSEADNAPAPAAAPAPEAEVLPDPFDPFNPVWERPLDQITGMAEQEYARVLAALTDQNHHAEALVLQAARTGDMMLRHHALELLRDQQREGSLTPDLKARAARLTARINGSAVEAPAPISTPTQDVHMNMKPFITIAADSIEKLRRIDVFRVLSAAGAHREGLATYIIENRPDLQREVLEVMADEWPDLGYSAPAAPAAPAVVQHTGGEAVGELLTPNADGTPKVLEVPALAPEAKTEQEMNPARAGDMAFLNSVISQSVDMWDDALADKIEGMAGTYESDAEVMELVGRAINSYTDFMLAAA